MRRIPLFHAWWFAIGSALVVEASDIALDQATHSMIGDVLGIAFLALYGVYCLQNYWLCQEIHCAITGPGLLLAAALMALRVFGLFDYSVGIPYAFAFLIALVGCVVEMMYAGRTGSHFRLRA